MVHGAVANGHHEARRRELARRTNAVALRDPRDILDDLAATRGLSWSMIARLTGVSPTAVRKWRRGEAITGEHRRRLAGIVAFLDLMSQTLGPIQDPSSWLEMPITDETTLTAVDIYATGGVNDLLDAASGRIDPHTMLDRLDPDWRQNYGKDDRFMVVRDSEGVPAIVERD
jgi:hypothetical protein